MSGLPVAWPGPRGPAVTDPDPRLPLLDALLAIRPGWREYDLLAELDRRRVPPFEATDRSTLGLFRRHFVLRHLLYRLRDRLLASGDGDLDLDARGVRRCRHPGPEPGGLVAPEPLRAYYLDPEELATTGAADVDALLAAFWRRYDAHARRDWALRELDLPADAAADTIRQRYRTLAMRHHPDRGGEAERFARINAAHAVLVGLRASVGGASPAREGDS
ncbi:MAG: DNA-J related domain-containing protein [Pseudomonadota bacterium]